jgi:hypothetical protein
MNNLPLDIVNQDPGQRSGGPRRTGMKNPPQPCGCFARPVEARSCLACLPTFPRYWGRIG